MNIKSNTSEYVMIEYNTSFDYEDSLIDQQENDDNFPDTQIKEDKEIMQNYTKSTIFISFSIAILFSFLNIIQSFICKYEFKGRELMAPGYALCSIVSLVVISIQSCKENSSWNHWIKEAYLNQRNRITIKPLVLRIKWELIFITVLICIISIFFHWTMIEGYYYASKVGLNNGFIMLIFLYKPLINSLSSYIFYGGNFKITNIFAIVILALSIFLIVYPNEESEDKIKFTLISFGYIFASILLNCFKNKTLCYYEKKFKRLNLAGIVNICNLLCSIVFMFFFLFDLIDGIFFTLSELLISQIASILTLAIDISIIFLKDKSKPKMTSILIKSFLLFQIVLDAALFDRYPNLIQIIGIFLSFLGCVMISFCY